MLIDKSIQASIEIKEKILSDTGLKKIIQTVSDEMVQSFKNGGQVLFCGNGGSAADAQHLASELSGRFYLDRDPLNAEALHVNTSFITAIANDYEVIIIADHGNADYAENADGSPNTAHSLNPVPFIYVTQRADAKVENGILADVAPSICKIMGIEQPKEMTGKVLIK